MTLAEPLDTIEVTAIGPALALLPSRLDTDGARIMLRAICLQESAGVHRYQVLSGGRKGPARGLWQFELGSKLWKGGVWGVFLHPASRFWLSELCRARGCEFDPRAIWEQLERDDVLAAGVARLLLFTDPRPLPLPGMQEDAWDCYQRNWRPGKPHPDRWPANYRRACAL